jgi:sphingomyelin phosphodiesterase acid-like 3
MRFKPWNPTQAHPHNVYHRFSLTYILLAIFFIVLMPLLGRSAYGDEFIALSDIHFDPFFECEKETNTSQPCEIIQHLNQTAAEQWQTVFEEFQEYKTPSLPTTPQETNFSLLESTLEQLKIIQNANQTEPASQKIKFIVLGGDYLGHNYQEKYQQYSKDLSESGYEAFVKKTMQFLILEIHQKLPNLPIIPAIGNNDSYSGDYVSDPHGLFYQDMGKLFWPELPQSTGPLRSKASQDFEKTFNQGGYYKIQLTPSEEIIILNSVLFSRVASSVSSPLNTAVTQEFSWLKREISQAQKNGSHVWILMHIPDVIDDYASQKAKVNIPLWNPVYDQAFLKIIHAHQNTITAILTGHFHRAGSFVYQTGSSDILDSYIPGIDSTHGNQPSFNIYTFDPDTFNLKTLSEYDLMLVASNSSDQNPKNQNIWAKKFPQSI